MRLAVIVASITAVGGALGVVSHKTSGRPSYILEVGHHILASDRDDNAYVIFTAYPSLTEAIQSYRAPSSPLICHLDHAENKGYCLLRLTQAFAGSYLRRELDAATTLTDDSDVRVKLAAEATLHQSDDDIGKLLFEHARRWLDPSSTLRLSAMKITCEDPLRCYLTLSNEPVTTNITRIMLERPGCAARFWVPIGDLGSVDSRVSVCPGDESSGLAAHLQVLHAELVNAFAVPNAAGESFDLATLKTRASWKLPRGIANVALAAPAIDGGALSFEASHHYVVGASSDPITLKRGWSLPVRVCAPVDEKSNHKLAYCHAIDNEDNNASEISCRTALSRKCGGEFALLITDQRMAEFMAIGIQNGHSEVTDGLLDLGELKLATTDPRVFVGFYKPKEQSIAFIRCEADDGDHARCVVRSLSCRRAEFSVKEAALLLDPSPAMIEQAGNCIHASLLFQH